MQDVGTLTWVVHAPGSLLPSFLTVHSPQCLLCFRGMIPFIQLCISFHSEYCWQHFSDENFWLREVFFSSEFSR